jgi:surface antigen
MRHRHLRNALLVLALAGQAGAVFALNTNFLRTSPVSRFNSKDLALMQVAFTQAMDAGADGVGVDWANERTRSGGTVTPQQSFERDGRKCRSASISTWHRNVRAEGVYSFCRDPQGDWRLQP